MSESPKTPSRASHFAIAAEHFVGVVAPGCVSLVLLLPILDRLGFWAEFSKNMPSWLSYLIALSFAWTIGEVVIAVGTAITYSAAFGSGYCVGFGRRQWRRLKHRTDTDRRPGEDVDDWLNRLADTKSAGLFNMPRVYSALAAHYSQELLPFMPRSISDFRVVVAAAIDTDARVHVPAWQSRRSQFIVGVAMSLCGVAALHSSYRLYFGSWAVSANGGVFVGIVSLVSFALLLHGVLWARAVGRLAIAQLYISKMRTDVSFREMQTRVGIGYLEAKEQQDTAS